MDDAKLFLMKAYVEKMLCLIFDWESFHCHYVHYN